MPELEIFRYDFMARALLAGVIVGLIAPVIGMFLVVKRYSLLADTLSHVSLVGVALGVLAGFNPVAGAMGTATIAAVGMERLRTAGRLFSESILALFLSGSFAVAVVLLSWSHGLNVDLFAYLFGSITTVSPADLRVIALFGLLVLSLTLWLFKQLFLVCYDEELAQASGLPAARLNLALMLLAATAVAISMRVIGVLLVGALIVIPVTSAMQFGRSFAATARLAVLLSLTAVVAGLVASFYLDLPSGGAIVLVCLLLFAVSLAANRRMAARRRP